MWSFYKPANIKQHCFTCGRYGYIASNVFPSKPWKEETGHAGQIQGSYQCNCCGKILGKTKTVWRSDETDSRWDRSTHISKSSHTEIATKSSIKINLGDGVQLKQIDWDRNFVGHRRLGILNFVASFRKKLTKCVHSQCGRLTGRQFELNSCHWQRNTVRGYVELHLQIGNAELPAPFLVTEQKLQLPIIGLNITEYLLLNLKDDDITISARPLHCSS